MLPEAPDDISREVRDIWDYTVRELEALGHVGAADRDALRCYCEAVVTHRKASRLLENSAIVIQSGNGRLTPSPVVTVQRDAANLIRSYAQEFGLTPAARARIEGSEREPDQPPDEPPVEDWRAILDQG